MGTDGADEISLDQRHWRILRDISPLLWPRGRPDLKIRVLFALLAMIGAKVTAVVVPLILGRAVDGLTHVSPGAGLAAVPVAVILGYGLFRFMSSGLQNLRDALIVKVSQNAQAEVSVDTFRHLHQLSLRFHLERRTGGLSRYIERGTNAIDFLLRWLVFNIVPTLIELILACAILAALFGWTYAALTAVTVGIYIWFTFVVTEWRTKFYRQMIARDAETGSRAVDSLLNFETVKYFNNEAHEANRYRSAAEDYAAAAVKSTSTLSFLNSGQAFIIGLGMTLLMLLAAYGVVLGRLTVGDFTAINMYLIQLSVPLNMLGFVYREIKQALADTERMFALREIPQEVTDKPGAPDLRVSAGEIVFDHVSFAYDPQRPILKDVSFRVAPGQVVAIVGPSGAGKSTISRLLFRFYDIGEGSVTIDGQDIRDVTQASLRRALGIVPQDTVLFNDTIAYNIAYGRPGAGEAEIQEAARIAQIHEFIASLPDGYQARVGERGLKLSGGEKQRVAIARTVLKGPPILILDEATSALDSHTERAIQTSLEEIAKGRTALVIAHRLSTIVNADAILVMESGRIVEQGTHAALLAKGGAYADLWARQQEIDHARSKLEAAGETLQPDAAAE